MSIVQSKNIAALITNRIASAQVSATAGGAGNNVAVTGLVIQRSLLGTPNSAAVSVLFEAVLGATDMLSLINVVVQDSADGIIFVNFATFTNPGVVATGPTGGGTVRGETTLAVDLEGARDYIQVDFTPVLSAASVDTAKLVAVMTLAGQDRLPAPL